MRPNFFVDYSDNRLDADIGDGVLTPINLVGTPTASNGYVNLQNDGALGYAALNNCNFGNLFTVLFAFSPNYNIAPPIAQISCLFNFSNYGDYRNNVVLFQDETASLYLAIRDDSENAIIAQYLGQFQFLQDEIYFVKLIVDIDTGATKLYINGTQIGVTLTQTGIRLTTDVLAVGMDVVGGGLSDQKVYQIVVFDSVYMNTYNYLYSLPDLPHVAVKGFFVTPDLNELSAEIKISAEITESIEIDDIVISNYSINADYDYTTGQFIFEKLISGYDYIFKFYKNGKMLNRIRKRISGEGIIDF